ncbi:MAG: hypothetical protein QM726_13165 [Chitinophagaceae bacterium]
MQLSLTSIILFVHDVDLLKQFYVKHFSFNIAEEIKGEWVLLNAGPATIGLHKVGAAFASATNNSTQNNNCKLVFETTEYLQQLHTQLRQSNVFVKEIQTWEGYGYTVFDGEDAEGNVFQVKGKNNI